MSKADEFTGWVKLDYLLGATGRAWTIRELAECLGVSAKTVRRDLIQFEEFRCDDVLHSEIWEGDLSGTLHYRYRNGGEGMIFRSHVRSHKWFLEWRKQSYKAKSMDTSGHALQLSPAELLVRRQANAAGLTLNQYRVLKALNKGKPEKTMAEIKAALGIQNINGKFLKRFHALGQERYLKSERVEGQRSLSHSISGKGKATIAKAIANV
jgi:DNA-binding MarR family transcriptional regulator